MKAWHGGIFLCVALLAAALLVIDRLSPVSAQDTTLSIDPASQTVSTATSFAVGVRVDNVTNLGSFEFTLQFDPNLLTFVGVAEVPFLESAGYEVDCHEVDPGTRISPMATPFSSAAPSLLPPASPESTARVSWQPYSSRPLPKKWTTAQLHFLFKQISSALTLTSRTLTSLTYLSAPTTAQYPSLPVPPAPLGPRP